MNKDFFILKTGNGKGDKCSKIDVFMGGENDEDQQYQNGDDAGNTETDTSSS